LQEALSRSRSGPGRFRSSRPLPGPSRAATLSGSIDGRTIPAENSVATLLDATEGTITVTR